MAGKKGDKVTNTATAEAPTGKADKKGSKVTNAAIAETPEVPEAPTSRFAGLAAKFAKLANLADLAKLKRALDPVGIIKYLLSILWKPVLFFTLLFSLFLGGAYAASYYKLIDARTALDFERRMVSLRDSESRAAEYLLPVAEWSSSIVAAAGELIQTQVERQEVIRIKREQERMVQKAEEERLAKLEAEKAEKEEKDKANQEKQSPAGGAVAVDQNREAERKRQEAELRKIAADRQQELSKRATKLAAYYSAMTTADAVRIMRNLDDEEIVLILNSMPDATVAQILAGFDPERASDISKNILRLQPTPELRRTAGVL